MDASELVADFTPLQGDTNACTAKSNLQHANVPNMPLDDETVLM